ncbi:MAG: hypothetical protein OEZ01_05055 [Candidatus Heimdallarchaeota archaeon]|nr:hypothetical protein [Candidatus Heimdallarchaeota archaeon]MDH5645351.1 hypothetical protein [Candidatus Heimdallarchaeota archaeon]
MNIKIDDLILTGKGFMAEEVDWLDDNFKMIANQVEFLQVKEKQTNTPIGWFVNGYMTVMADLTVHTTKGMKGKSIKKELQYTLILDTNLRLKTIIPEDLTDFDIEKPTAILQKILSNNWKKVNLKDSDTDISSLVLLSTASDTMLLQEENQTIWISSEDGIFVLNKKNDKLTMVSKNDGILNINGDQDIQLGNGEIRIDGEVFNPEKIIQNISQSINKAFKSMKFSFD